MCYTHLNTHTHINLCVRVVSIPKELLSPLDKSQGHQETITGSPQTKTIPSVVMGAGRNFAPNLSSSFQEEEKLTKDIVNHPDILFYYYYYFPDSENSTNGQWQCFQAKVTIM